MFGIEQYQKETSALIAEEQRITSLCEKASKLHPLTTEEVASLTLAYVRGDWGLDVPKHIVCYYLTKLKEG